MMCKESYEAIDEGSLSLGLIRLAIPIALSGMLQPVSYTHLEVTPFIVTIIVALLLLIFFPQIAYFLPEMLYR